MAAHYLTYLANEDEAQMTGYKFEVKGETVIVSETFHFAEYADLARPKVMSKPEARAFWKKLIATGEFVAIK